MLMTGGALVATCLFVAGIIGILHLKEKQQDRKEKWQQAQRFHFDAMWTNILTQNFFFYSQMIFYSFFIYSYLLLFSSLSYNEITFFPPFVILCFFFAYIMMCFNYDYKGSFMPTSF